MIPELREFLYVDVDRTRSLLAQLHGGVIDSIRSEIATTTEGGASATILGIGARGGASRVVRSEEARSLQDLTFVAFEQLANEEGLITELGQEYFDPHEWASGRLHEMLSPGQLIRLTCDVHVLDGSLFRERVQRFDRMAEALVQVGAAPVPGETPKKKAARVERAKDLFYGGEFTSSQLAAISEFVESFVGDSISVRLLPCGANHLEYGFGGPLLGRKEYIQEERENLFSRYGHVATNWTAVAQVASVPTPQDTSETVDDDVEVIDEEGNLSRPRMERLARNVLAMMEGIGVVAGPRWPTVSITPLALYRLVPARRSA